MKTKKINPISRKSRKILSASKCSNFKLNDKQNMSAFIKKTSMIENNNNNNNNNNNTKTIDDFMTEKDYLNFKLNENKISVHYSRRHH